MMSTSQGNSKHVIPTKAGVQASVSAAGLPPNAAEVLVQNLDETVLLGTVGTDPNDLAATEATLVCVALDMSGSMSPYRRHVIDAYNSMIDALRGSREAESILLSTWTFEDAPRLLSGYTSVTKASSLTQKEYIPSGATALYDTLLACMTGLVSYGQALLDHGVPTKRVLFVLSDGGDNSSRASSLDVRTAATALRAEEVYTLAYAGFGSSNLSHLAAEVGFPSVITAKASPSEVRRIFRQASAGVIRVSQGVAPSAGGFF
jgi:Mg-chelatase subunit ChlD